MAKDKGFSKGCRLCHEGNWLCVYVTDRCTRACSFCSQRKSKKGFAGYRSYIDEPLQFDDAEEVVDFLKEWRTNGLGISGGEPLLESDKTLGLIRKAKEAFGRKIHIWLYTNGDLLDSRMGGRLSRAGLDEIRLDLEARNFNLAPLVICKGKIGTLTVEIPVIAGHEEKIIEVLPRLEKLGVKHLNLHELMVSKENANRLNVLAGKSGRKISAEEVYAAKGSLAAARKIEGYIRERGIKMGVNVCTLGYKQREQTGLILERMRRA